MPADVSEGMMLSWIVLSTMHVIGGNYTAACGKTVLIRRLHPSIIVEAVLRAILLPSVALPRHLQSWWSM
jgi:hypothetical protein